MRPVLLSAYYGHGAVANSKALPLLQLANDEPDPAGGYHERVPGSNEINGRFWEYAQWKPTRLLANSVSDDDALIALKELSDAAVRAATVAGLIIEQLGRIPHVGEHHPLGERFDAEIVDASERRIRFLRLRRAETRQSET